MSEESIRGNMAYMGFEQSEIEEAVLAFGREQRSQEEPVPAERGAAQA
jgi:hypothetical protein